ncbi:Vitamin B12-binding protein [Austwickia sp. TVS 96-490-7B]|uniref:ABC transporter substrate-binding protein n=1 Tax=Austwickia sp. TVS 96-490-7B TaxID=2830843 RepID=UPI001C567585|nr:ABC transporter substrate-binding protein [Austwickia sp. TVS 96-490-7B]MBW3084326.1 Vitamin B12-binding protein [Austwickia sp. TVS 96-490-7B]
MKLKSALTVGVLSTTLVLSACGQDPASHPASSGAALTITDAAGRTVTFEKKPQRVIFGEQRQAYASMVLNKDNPVDKVVAWGADMERAAPDMYERLVKATPAAKDIPKVGAVTSGDLSVEALLAHKPDVYIMTLDSMRAAKKNGLLDQFDKAGLKYVVTDFRIDPAKNTNTTMRALGQVLDRTAQAEEFLTYYRDAVDPVMKKAGAASTKTSVLMWRAPGLKPCCSTWKGANFGQMLTQVGGENIADSVLTGEEGDLTAEQVISAQPKVVIATGGAWSKQKLDEKAKTSFLNIGYNTPKDQAAASLKDLQRQPGFEHLKAFHDGAVHGIYHQFYDAPFNFIAYQAFAKWQHPDLFTDLDPEKNWHEFSAQFMPFPAEGTVIATVN